MALKTAFDHVHREVLWGVLRDYGVSSPLIWAVGSLYDQSQSLVRIAGTKSDSFLVRVGFSQGCPLSLIPRIKISTSKSEDMDFSRRKVDCLLQVWGEILPQVEEFKYFGVLFMRVPENGARDRQAHWCSGRSDASSTPRGEEGAEPKGKALCLPVDLRHYPYLWSRALGTGGSNEFPGRRPGRSPRDDPGHAGGTMFLCWPGNALGFPPEEMDKVAGESEV